MNKRGELWGLRPHRTRMVTPSFEPIIYYLAQNREGQLFTKNTGVSLEVTHCIGSEACPVQVRKRKKRREKRTK